MSIYLVTGGAGFIGSNFIKHIFEIDNKAIIINVDKLTYAGNLSNIKAELNNENHIFIKEDICNKEVMDRVFSKYSPNYVVNFAAESHVDRSIESSEDFIKSNVLGTNALLEVAVKYDIDKFIQISTDEVYGSINNGLFNEDSPLKPNNPYAASKASADLLVQSYKNTYKLPINITRCTNNFGPNQHTEKLIPMVIKNYINGEYIPVYGDGKNIRDWIYVNDHCKAIERVLIKGELGEIYNIGTNNEICNLDIINCITEEIDRLFLEKKDYTKIGKNLINFVEDRKGHDKRYALDSSKIRNCLGWAYEDNFTDNIRNTVSWYFNKL